MKNKNKKWDKDVVICIGTDIPPLSTQELMLWSTLKQLEKERIEIIRQFMI